MKTEYFVCLLAAFVLPLVSTELAFGQASTTKPNPLDAPERPKLTRFDLDFPGGTPRELVAFIQHATGRPLNVIMRDEDATAKLPALKLKNVTVVDLFRALENIGQTTERMQVGTDEAGKPIYRDQRVRYLFSASSSEKDDDSIWTFVSAQSSPSPRTVEPKDIRYYNLAPYLDTFKIDDITTAVRTGWEMLGDPTGAKFSFHKDTKLLVAVGWPDQLSVIDSVLKELDKSSTKQAAGKVRGKVYIWGQVRTQGPIEIPEDEKFTAGKAILRAGGFGEFANKTKVKLIRTLPDGKKQEQLIDMDEIFGKGRTEKDVELKNDDFIIVPEKVYNL